MLIVITTFGKKCMSRISNGLSGFPEARAIQLLTNQPMHYAKVVKTGFEVVNSNKQILHQFATKISKIFNDVV